ncbi:MAG: ABC-F family ATP-binding cassette domain-containing protein [Mycoplasmatales bacterium]
MNFLFKEATMRFSTNYIFKNQSLVINENEKIAVVGKNGIGKSTLLKILLGTEVVEGTFQANATNKIAYLEQNPQFNPNFTVEEQVKASLVKTEVTDYEVAAILNKFGFPNHQTKVESLSGGEERRLQLGIILLQKSNVLLLDEPTNHLDFQMIDFLESFLRKYKGLVVMVSHDRRFIDQVCNVIIELADQQLFRYAGNYSALIEARHQRMIEQAAIDRKNKNMYKLEKAWMMQGAKARSSKSRERKERFEKLESIVKKSQNTDTLDITIKPLRLGSKVIDINDYTLKVEERLLIDNINLSINKYDRVGIIGGNGVGKTTLLNKIVAEMNNPDRTSPEIIVGETVKIGYFSQTVEFTHPEQKVIEYVEELGSNFKVEGDELTPRALLKLFLFDENMLWQPLKVLSGGEKKRLQLLAILITRANVLILDEPTNDLDLDTLMVLEQYLENFQGSIIVVSHDRYFLDNICDYYYLINEQTLLKSNELVYKPVKTNKVVKEKIKQEKPKQVKVKLTYAEQLELKTIDQEIETTESKLTAIDQKIEQHASDFKLLSELLEERKVFEEELLEKQDRWFYLNEKLEQQNSQ